MEEHPLSKIRIALAGLSVSALVLSGVAMTPAMAAKSKVKSKSVKVIKQKSGKGGSARSGNAGAGGAGGNGGPVANNQPGAAIALNCAPVVPAGPVLCVFGGPVSTGGAGGAGGASGAAVGGAGGANVNAGSNVDTNTNSGNAVSAG